MLVNTAVASINHKTDHKFYFLVGGGWEGGRVPWPPGQPMPRRLWQKFLLLNTKAKEKQLTRCVLMVAG